MKVKRKMVKIGLEKILSENVALLKDARVGLVCNQASVNREFSHAADLFFEHREINLTTLFGPQHGIRGDVQDNMIETAHTVDQATQLPVYSLYSETREPTAEMLENVDVLVVDLVDVGCRVYTFMYTMANCLRAAAKFGKKVIVGDRPNPINGVDVEGNILEPEFASFVGQFPIPMRHGLTIGELARLFNHHFKIDCELEVVEMDGWKREWWFDETNAAWVMPSPNMPTPDTAIVFPGTVFFEGTQVSEGRGTTRPFEIVGAPFIDARQYAKVMNELELPGVVFRPWEFLPTFQKHAKVGCGGVHLHVVDRNSFESVLTGMALVKTAFDLYPADFKWKNPPYEYVYDKNPFDVIAGTDKIRRDFESGKTLTEIKDSWQEGIEKYKALRSNYLLY